MMYTFTIKGKIKPCVRMTQKSKHYGQAQEYLVSQAAIGLQLKVQAALHGWEILPARTPLSVSLVFTFPGGWHQADIDNQIKSVLDAANDIVWKDDRWVDALTAIRRNGDDYECVMRVEVL